MSHLRALSLGTKLNLALLAFLLLLGAATSGIIIYGFNRTQESATDRSNAALEEQGKLALQAFVGGISAIGSLQLEAAAEAGRRAALYVDAQPQPAAAFDTSTLAVSAAGHHYDPDPGRIADLLVISGVDAAAADVQDDIAFSAPLETVFPIVLQGFEGDVGGRDFDPIAIVFISTNGVTRYYPPTGIHDALPANADFTERMGQIGPANNPERRTIWTPPYEDGGGQGQIITARTPVYDGETFRGSLEVDVSIARLIDQINGIRPTPRGFAFYLDSAGALLKTHAFELLSGEAENNQQLAAILESMQRGETIWPTPVETLDLQGEEFFIAYLPADVPGGSIAVAAPVSDVTAQAATITAGIDDEGDRTLLVVIVSMGALFAIGLAGASYLNRRVILKPINSLVSATRAVAAGDYTTKVSLDREDELGTLGASFNTMVEQLRESERVLEQRVDERTRELNALLDVSQRISSELSLDDLVDTIVRVAAELFDTTGATVTAVDAAGGATLLGTNSTALAELGVARGFTYSMEDFGILWDELLTGRGIVVDDVSGDSAFAVAYRQATQPEAPELHRQGRSWMAVPMMTQGRVIGWLAVTHREPGRYGDAHLSIARAMASQAAVALENARLFGEAQQRTRELSTLLDVSLNAAASIELEPLLNLVLGELGGVIPHDRVAIQTYEHGYLTVLAARDASPAGASARRSHGYQAKVSDDFFATQFPEGMPAIIDDILDEGDLAREFRASAHPHINSGLVPHGSYLAIPLMSRDHVVGLLTLMRDQPGFYTVDHARLGRAIGSQIAIAVDRARLFEGEARRSRELSTLLEVSRNVASRIELDPLLESVLDQVRTVADYNRGVLSVIEDGMLTIRAVREFAGTPGYQGQARIGMRFVMSHEAVGNQFESPDPVIINDVNADTPAARAYRERLHADVDRATIPDGSYMAIPLIAQDTVVGLISLSRDQTGFYTSDHARLTRAIASQAASAIQNARLYETAQQRARETEALLRADQELFGTLDLDEVLEALVDVAVDVLGVDKSIVVLHQGEVDVVRAARNFAPENLIAFNQAIAAMPHEEPPPEGQTPQVYIDAPAEAPEFVRKTLIHEGIRSHVSVPVKDANRMLGVFGVSFVVEHAFTDDEQRLYVALADRAAVAIQNAELYEKAQHAASLEERQRLARELHDSVSQALYGIALGARTARLRIDENPATAAEPIEYVATLAEAGLAEMRALIFELRPESLETEGLVVAIEKQVASTRARHQITIDADLMEEPDCRLDIKEALYRITQEALQNIVKHASATRATVELVQHDGALRLTVADDGRGFDPAQEFPGHIGLHSMPERAAKLGGSVVVASRPGSGTRVVTLIPV